MIVLIGSTYALYKYSKYQNAFNMTTNGITFSFKSGTNELKSNSAYPISDAYAIANPDKLSYIDFTVIGNPESESDESTYAIYITPKSGNTLSGEYVKIYLTDENENIVAGPYTYNNLSDMTERTGKILYNGREVGEFTSNYKLYAWVDESYLENVSKTFNFYVNIHAYNTAVDLYTVTFDYNDGVTPKNTIQVTYGEEYGELPTPPERIGYTFKGWNGKNLFDKSNIDNGHFIVTKTGDVSNTPGSDRLDDWASTVLIKVNPNTMYIKSGNIGAMTQDYFDINENLIEVIRVASNELFLTPNNCYYVKFNLN